MGLFVDQERFLVLLKEYQFRAYDRPLLKGNMPYRCAEQIKATLETKEDLLKEKQLPLEERPRKGFKKEPKTDETLDRMVESMDRYIEFKRKCLENHMKCQNSKPHREKTNRELAAI